MTILYSCLAAGMFAFLLACPSRGLTAARYALALWANTLVPTLLPFLILSGFCIQSGLLARLSVHTERLPAKFRKLSPSGCFALLAGFLCGFPTGAKILGDLRRNNKISASEAQLLLSFCNNASPGFVMTYLIHEKLGMDSQPGMALLLIYGIPLAFGFLCLLRCPAVPEAAETKKAPGAQITFGLLDACIYDACITILKLGGYLMLFSILAEMITCLPFLSDKSCAIVTAFLELTGGIDRITTVFPQKTAVLAAIPLTVFGGLCTLAQTASVLKGSALSIGPYLRAKTALSLFALAGAALWLYV